MPGDDDDKTVFGGKLPTPPKPAPRPGRAAPSTGDADRTVIGGALPPQRPATPQGGGFGGQADTSGNTWLGGAVPQQPSQPSEPPRNFGQPAAGAGIAGNQGFFPDVPADRGPAQSGPQTPRIALDEALKATGLGQGGPSNPLLAAAANLLILFGRLRTGMVEMQAEPLMDHVVREISTFEQNAIQAGADPHEAAVAKYALCGTADDIVQNLPGADRGKWLEYSMVARFFNRRDSGVGFFQEAEKAMQAPAQRYDLLELMLVCLSLGFEGQYRTLPNGSMELARIRAAIYETLRRCKPRPDEDISVNWAAVPLGGRKRGSGVPLWIAASIGAVLVVGSYAGLSTWINRDGADVARFLHRLHPNTAQITLFRTTPVKAFVPVSNTTQIDRIKTALAPQIADNSVEVGEKGNYIFIRVGNVLLFDSGSATVKTEFADLAREITETLNAEAGPVRVLGYTDDIQPSGRGRFKSNLDLSVARAEGVSVVLEQQIDDPARLSVEGMGEADPIADNATPEGRALNRRVDILLAKEGTF